METAKIEAIHLSEVDGMKYPEIDRRKRKCRWCGKRLSKYNLNMYCFVHTFIRLRSRDKRAFDRRCAERRKANRRKP